MKKRQPEVDRDDWISMSKKARHELVAFYAARSTPAAPVRSRKTHVPPNRSMGQVASIMCSLVAFACGQPQGELCELNSDADSDDDNADVF